jgi:hypothetical protein
MGAGWFRLMALFNGLTEKKKLALGIKKSRAVLLVSCLQSQKHTKLIRN